MPKLVTDIPEETRCFSLRSQLPRVTTASHHIGSPLFSVRWKSPYPNICIAVVGSPPEEHGATFGMGDVAWSRRQLLLKYLWHFKDMANQVIRTPGHTPKVGKAQGRATRIVGSIECRIYFSCVRLPTWCCMVHNCFTYRRNYT